ncbi:MAG TPA: hypothetical protein VEG30_03970 [Terriglobales bacterium]|nr:hypothetical protein [Terriglobales bacterium]
MKSGLTNIICLMVLALCFTPLGRAQNLQVNPPGDLTSRNRDAIEVTRDQVRTDRKAMVEKAMKLTDDEAQGFWPIYDEYASELSKISDRTVTLITEFADNYSDLRDSDALRMTDESLNIEQQKLAVKQRYAQRFATVLPGKKVARFFQVDRRLDAVVVLNVSQAVSLVQ